MKKLSLMGAVLAAAAAVFLAHLYLDRLEAEVSGGPKQAVLVAAEDLPVGKVLTKELLAVRDIPHAYLDRRHIRAAEVKKILGTRIASGVRSNEPVLWSDLAKFSDHTRLLSGLVQNGMRAVALDGRSATFDGLLRPGDRVDVLFTRREQGEEPSATSTLLQNLLVLSVGGNIARIDDLPTARFGSGAVVLSASAKQAQLLAEARQHGRLTLTLRNPEDITLLEALPETKASDLLAAQAENTVRSRLPSKREIDHVR